MKQRLSDCLRVWVHGWVQLACGVVEVLSLGLVSPEWRANLVFSDWWMSEFPAPMIHHKDVEGD